MSILILLLLNVFKVLFGTVLSSWLFTSSSGEMNTKVNTEKCLGLFNIHLGIYQSELREIIAKDL